VITIKFEKGPSTQQYPSGVIQKVVTKVIRKEYITNAKVRKF